MLAPLEARADALGPAILSLAHCMRQQVSNREAAGTGRPERQVCRLALRAGGTLRPLNGDPDASPPVSGGRPGRTFIALGSPTPAVDRRPFRAGAARPCCGRRHWGTGRVLRRSGRGARGGTTSGLSGGEGGRSGGERWKPPPPIAADPAVAAPLARHQARLRSSQRPSLPYTEPPIPRAITGWSEGEGFSGPVRLPR